MKRPPRMVAGSTGRSRRKEITAPTAFPPVPDEILVQVLIRLPVKSLLRFKCVCRAWRTLISEPFFVEFHLRQQSLIDPQILLLSCAGEVGELCLESLADEGGRLNRKLSAVPVESILTPSCNGLILIHRDYSQCIYVFNVASRKLLTLPDCSPSLHVNLGLGYEFPARKYKVVRLFYNREGDAHLQCEIFTLGSGAWRRIGEVPYKLDVRGFPASVNGALYWLTNSEYHLNKSEVIISFVLREERFKVIPHPKFCAGENRRYMQLWEFKGDLYLQDSSGKPVMHLWVSKDPKEGIWVKNYTINLQRSGYALHDIPYVKPVSICRNGRIYFSLFGRLFYYDPLTKTFEGVLLDLALCEILFPYVESLVPLGKEMKM
ncbi:putative F-box/kelch-repeat protein At1g12870 [Aristolochia californica]|uniref:putative F-box/kelch-repeat protein At1g12870 n=1 Tax=Aristolochia californica TaxID=171875 RepID=UPI0035DEAEA9